MRTVRGVGVAVLAAVSVVVLGGVVAFASLQAASRDADAADASATAAASAATLAAEAAAIPATPAVVSLGAQVAAPWAAPSDPVLRAATAGLGMLGTEGTVLHIHTHLTVTIDGVSETVPGEVGIDQTTGRVSPLHTHDTTGILHIESPVQADFTLGQFFTEWNVALDAGRIGSYTATDGQVLTVFVNQTPTAVDPASLVFTNKMDIDLVMHPASVTPVAPAPFDWPAQY